MSVNNLNEQYDNKWAVSQKDNKMTNNNMTAALGKLYGKDKSEEERNNKHNYKGHCTSAVVSMRNFLLFFLKALQNSQFSTSGGISFHFRVFINCKDFSPILV